MQTKLLLDVCNSNRNARQASSHSMLAVDLEFSFDAFVFGEYPSSALPVLFEQSPEIRVFLFPSASPTVQVALQMLHGPPCRIPRRRCQLSQ
jgi:hypothetical protein